MSPFGADAATKRPSCSLTVTTPAGNVKIDDEKGVLLRKGDKVTIEWDSKNATKAFDDDGDAIALSGSATSSPSKTSTYTYRFVSGSKKAICEIVVSVVTGSINDAGLSSNSSKPTLSGKATGVKTVQVEIYQEGKTKPLFVKKSVKVKNNSWKAKVTKKLPDGLYDVVVRGPKDMALNTIATRTLVIGENTQNEPTSDTTFVVKSVPLLSGGMTRAGATVSVSYLQVINIGKESGSLKEVSLKQNGSASTKSIVAFTIVDDLGGSKNSIGGTEGSLVFKDGVVKLPVSTTIAAGQTRLFTIKAVMANNVSSYLGKQLMIDVTAVDANASVKGAFPIRGTTWTIGY